MPSAYPSVPWWITRRSTSRLQPLRGPSLRAKVQLLVPSAVRASATCGPVRATVSIERCRPSSGSNRTVAVAWSMRAMVGACGRLKSSSRAEPLARWKGGANPGGWSITSCSACTVTPGIQRCHPSSRGCGQRHAADRLPSMAKCLPVASLTLSLIHGLARFQSTTASNTPSTTSSAAASPSATMAPFAMRRPSAGAWCAVAVPGLERSAVGSAGSGMKKGRVVAPTAHHAPAAGRCAARPCGFHASPHRGVKRRGACNCRPCPTGSGTLRIPLQGRVCATPGPGHRHPKIAGHAQPPPSPRTPHA